jgi:nucleoside-diphosphate-sugar epimerase
MPKTIIFGGSGKVARHLATALTSATPPHSVISVIRNPDQSASLSALGASPLVQSIEDSSIADLRAVLEREAPDNVVWSAGAGGGDPARTLAVDRDGAIKVMDAIAAATYTTTDTGVESPKRFVMVSAVDVRDRDNKPVPEWYTDADKERSDKGWGAIGVYMKAKLAADAELVRGNETRRLRYTIVRPGGLTTEPGAGRVQAGKVGIVESISREDVARTVAAVLNNDKTIGLAFDVVGPGEGEAKQGLPIEEAVEKVASERDDTFEGYY